MTTWTQAQRATSENQRGKSSPKTHWVLTNKSMALIHKGQMSLKKLVSNSQEDRQKDRRKAHRKNEGKRRELKKKKEAKTKIKQVT